MGEVLIRQFSGWHTAALVAPLFKRSTKLKAVIDKEKLQHKHPVSKIYTEFLWTLVFLSYRLGELSGSEKLFVSCYLKFGFYQGWFI